MELWSLSQSFGKSLLFLLHVTQWNAWLWKKAYGLIKTPMFEGSHFNHVRKDSSFNKYLLMKTIVFGKPFRNYMHYLKLLLLKTPIPEGNIWNSQLLKTYLKWRIVKQTPKKNFTLCLLWWVFLVTIAMQAGLQWF